MGFNVIKKVDHSHTLDSAYHTDVGSITEAQGQLLYYNGTQWVALGPGTSGQFLKTQGAAANPMWDTAGGSSISIASRLNTGTFSLTTSLASLTFTSDICVTGDWLSSNNYIEWNGSNGTYILTGISGKASSNKAAELTNLTVEIQKYTGSWAVLNSKSIDLTLAVVNTSYPNYYVNIDIPFTLQTITSMNAGDRIRIQAKEYTGSTGSLSYYELFGIAFG